MTKNHQQFPQAEAMEDVIKEFYICQMTLDRDNAAKVLMGDMPLIDKPF